MLLHPVVFPDEFCAVSRMLGLNSERPDLWRGLSSMPYNLSGRQIKADEVDPTAAFIRLVEAVC